MTGDAPPSDLERDNRTLERKLRRLEENVRLLEITQDTSSKLPSQLLRDLEAERARSRELLLNVLPERIVRRLEGGEGRIADRHEAVTVLFSDVVGFTPISASLEPHVLIEELNDLFSGFDAACALHGVEKVKTIGDAYLVVGGLSGDRDAAASAAAVADAALDMLAFVANRSNPKADWQLRIGMHTGPLVAGVVGTSRFAYDVWGDTVNVASRLETSSEPGRIHVSEEVAQALRDEFVLEPRGQVELKGKGPSPTSFLVGRRPGPAAA